MPRELKNLEAKDIAQKVPFIGLPVLGEGKTHRTINPITFEVDLLIARERAGR